MVDTAAPRRPRLLVALLTVLLVVVVAASVAQLRDRLDGGAEVRDLRPVDIGSKGWASSSAGRAVQAARTAATTYFTIDSRTVEADMDAMRALGTSEFVEGYDRGATALADRIVERGLRLSGRIPRDGSATEYLVTDRAIVLVSVDVTTSREGARGSSRYRTRIALDLVDGRWLVASLDEVT